MPGILGIGMGSKGRVMGNTQHDLDRQGTKESRWLKLCHGKRHSAIQLIIRRERSRTIARIAIVGAALLVTIASVYA